MSFSRRVWGASAAASDAFRAALGRLRPASARVKSPGYLATVGAIAALAILAIAANQDSFTLALVFASIYITLALAWDFSSGLTGYINFGLPFFFALGAFATGYFYYNGRAAVPLLLVLAFGVGLLGGFLFAFPTLRLRGPFFTFLSLLLPLIGTDFVVAFWTVLGLPTIGYYGLPFLGSNLDQRLAILSLVNGVFVTVLFLLRHSHFGLVLRGIRDDEEVVEAQGVHSFPYKVVAFTLANGVVGFAGGAYALTTTIAGVDAFGFTFLLFPILIAILGGTGEILGAVFAGYAIIVVYEFLYPILGTLALLGFSAVAILLVLFLPGGVIRLLHTGES